MVVELTNGQAGLVRAVPMASLGAGSKSYMEQYGVKYPLYTGAMAKGIASAEICIAAGSNGMLASFGAGGLPLDLGVSKGIDQIQAALGDKPFAVNLIHSPADDGLESGGVELFMKKGVRIVEASAFMSLTPWIVRYRVCGLERGRAARRSPRTRSFSRCRAPQLAELAMRPAGGHRCEAARAGPRDGGAGAARADGDDVRRRRGRVRLRRPHRQPPHRLCCSP